jgi:hypothetical protein
MHLFATSSCPSLVFFLQIFLPSRLDILLPFPNKKDPIWLGLFGQVSLPENSSYNNCCSELDPFTYYSHSFGSGVEHILLHFHFFPILQFMCTGLPPPVSVCVSMHLSLHVCLSLSLADLLLHLQAPSLAVSHKCK